MLFNALLCRKTVCCSKHENNYKAHLILELIMYGVSYNTPLCFKMLQCQNNGVQSAKPPWYDEVAAVKYP